MTIINHTIAKLIKKIIINFNTKCERVPFKYCVTAVAYIASGGTHYVINRI